MGPIKEWEILQHHLTNKTENEVLKCFFNFAYRNRLSIALWRHPLQSEKHLILDLSGSVNYVKADLEALAEGFILSPFFVEGGHQNIFINNHVYYSTFKKELITAPYLGGLDGDYFNLEYLQADLSGSFDLPSGQRTSYYTNGKSQTGNGDKAHYLEMVRSAIDAINRGKFNKVVPARTQKVNLTESFDLIEAFEKSCGLYPNALVSVVSVPGIGTWMGATPEELISVDKAKIFSTVALAGTQEIGDDEELLEVGWRQKEIEEQAMVSRYIINCFKKIRLREFEEQGPRTARAGRMAHLKTDFLVDTIATNFPQLGTVMLELLHPTSAVCGMPKEPAMEFLKNHEDFDRAFFSGYLGPVNMFDETHLFVNIRCMQLFEEKAVLYAGAGVTAISDVEKEWEETCLKCRTMLKVLG